MGIDGRVVVGYISKPPTGISPPANETPSVNIYIM